MPLQSAPLPGETISLNPGDAAGQARIFAENAARSRQNAVRVQSQRPQLPQIRQVGGAPRPQAFKTRFQSHPQAPQVDPTVTEKMAIAIWSGGWWNETLEMLQNFAKLDGFQDRRLVLVDTEMHPCPTEIIQAARNSFTEFHIFRSQDTLAPGGLSSPRAMIGLAGFIAEKLRHTGPVFFTMPLRPLLTGSLDRLELEHRQAMTDQRQILGTIVGQGDDRQPYGCFVAHREWIYDPNFPLAQGVGMSPAAMSPMKYMRYEMLRHFRVTKTILPHSQLSPERDTFLQAFNLAGIPRDRPLYGTSTPTQSAAATAADDLDSLIAGASGAPAAFAPGVVETGLAAGEVVAIHEEEQIIKGADYPSDEELKNFVHEHGLAGILNQGAAEYVLERAIVNPNLLKSLALAEIANQKAGSPEATVMAPPASLPPPPPPTTGIQTRKVSTTPKTSKNPPKAKISPKVL